jgi:UPF0176 protein
MNETNTKENTANWPILNIAGYQFVRLDGLSELQIHLRELAKSLELKGTILLAEEGINLFLAGLESSVNAFLKKLRENPAFANFSTKNSWSEHQPFQRLLVKIKNEIIRMNHPTIQPDKGRAKFISPKKLEEWLNRGKDDLGREVVLIDTRNDFEVEYGTFRNALHFNIKKFSEFPQAIESELQKLSDKTLVSFCTGGIRCEKSGLYSRERGLEHSYQLDGGILQYFEDVGEAHYVGNCFVFDERETLEPNLTPKSIKRPIKNKAKNG